MKAGKLIQDGTLTWILDDVRDGARVGDIVMRPTLRDGYIKANGATVKASEYPRLLAWVQESNMTVTAEQYQTDCSKYVYDAVQDKLTLPNATGRVLQGGESVKSVEEGLPNITGQFPSFEFHSMIPSNDWCKGAYTYRNEGTTSNLDIGDSGAAILVSYDASKANAIYGRSETVQPPAIALIAQIKY